MKLADFGSCRGVYSKPPYTEYISTRWYRPPECLLTDGHYTYKMDVWSVGCVFFEMLTCATQPNSPAHHRHCRLYPLFPGANEVDQIAKIHDVLGTPSPALLAKIRKCVRCISCHVSSAAGTLAPPSSTSRPRPAAGWRS